MPGPWHLLSKGSGHCQQHNRGPQPDSVTPDQGKGKVCVWVWVSPVPECTCRIHSPVNSVCPCPCPALGSGQDGRRGAITTLVLTGALTEGEAGRVARQKCCAPGRAFVHGGAAEIHRGCSPGSGGCINHRNETLGQALSTAIPWLHPQTGRLRLRQGWDIGVDRGVEGTGQPGCHLAVVDARPPTSPAGCCARRPPEVLASVPSQRAQSVHIHSLRSLPTTASF